ncbi:hypothetical protein FB570_12257 [Streptomyces sp. T12]|nr:hypothetical protein FB570_12257 [Streptomyces sp. T12]
MISHTGVRRGKAAWIRGWKTALGAGADTYVTRPRARRAAAGGRVAGLEATSCGF